MTEVNYAEVKYIILRKDGPEAWVTAAQLLPGLPIEFHPADRRLAELAADVKARHRLSLADAFAAALTKKRKKRNSPPATRNSRRWQRKSRSRGFEIRCPSLAPRRIARDIRNHSPKRWRVPVQNILTDRP